jgi:hypothetical protein
MVLSDTTNRENGLIQRCEDNCSLGATGITDNATLFSQFVGWLNQWNGMGAHYAIQAWHGHDFDDKGYTTAPRGTFAGATTRDYNFDDSYKMLKLKLVNVTYDGTNYYPATPVDSADLLTQGIAVKDPNVDGHFSLTSPQYDLTANGFNLYPKFTAAQVTAGAKVYVEWWRMPRAFATTGTDAYQPCMDFQFHHFPSVGASYEYCKLYKPELAKVLKEDLYGDGGKKQGLITDLTGWYASKQPSSRRAIPMAQNNR